MADNSTPQTTTIAANCRIRGDLHLAGPATIAGHIEGSIISEQSLEVCASGGVEGDIDGVLMDIDGTVRGNITASGTCRLGVNARVTGELRAANLVIAEGACFAGHVHIGMPAESEPQDAPAEALPVEEAPKSAIGTINRIEALTAQADAVATMAAAPTIRPEIQINNPAPSVRVASQTVLRMAQRTPQIIKAR